MDAFEGVLDVGREDSHGIKRQHDPGQPSQPHLVHAWCTRALPSDPWFLMPRHRATGPQFKVRFLRTSAPTSTEGIETTSPLDDPAHRPGLRPQTRPHAERVFDVIETEPDSLRQVDGIWPGELKGLCGRMSRAERCAGDHDVPAHPQRWHSKGSPHLQDLRRRRRPGSENPYRQARDTRLRHGMSAAGPSRRSLHYGGPGRCQRSCRTCHKHPGLDAVDPTRNTVPNMSLSVPLPLPSRNALRARRRPHSPH
jgi:hypothetical protein